MKISIASIAVLFAIINLSLTSVITTNILNGQDNLVYYGSNNQVDGKNNKIAGTNNQIAGNTNGVKGDSNALIGQQNVVTGSGNHIKGKGNIIAGQGNIVLNSDQPLPADLQQKFSKLSSPKGISSSNNAAANNSNKISTAEVKNQNSNIFSANQATNQNQQKQQNKPQSSPISQSQNQKLNQTKTKNTNSSETQSQQPQSVQPTQPSQQPQPQPQSSQSQIQYSNQNSQKDKNISSQVVSTSIKQQSPSKPNQSNKKNLRADNQTTSYSNPGLNNEVVVTQSSDYVIQPVQSRYNRKGTIQDDSGSSASPSTSSGVAALYQNSNSNVYIVQADTTNTPVYNI